MPANINDKPFSWASVEMRSSKLGLVIGFTAIKYPWKVEREPVRGASRKVLGYTRGKLVPGDGSLTMLEAEYRKLASQPGWCDGESELIVQYSEPGMPTYTDTVKGVLFDGADSGGEEGTDGLKREVSFKFKDILLNGVSPIATNNLGQ